MNTGRDQREGQEKELDGRTGKGIGEKEDTGSKA
jgi:hypothetical protein